MQKKVVTAINRFGFDLFDQLQLNSQGRNLIYSPLSVATALTIAYNGAAGETGDEMARSLHLDGLNLDEINRAAMALIKTLQDSDSQVELAIANSIWARDGIEFERDFLQRNRQFFGAEISSLDFADPRSVDTINHWVGLNTNGKIPTIIEMIDPMSVLFLINAVYFKGQWQTPFDPELTADGTFHLLSGARKRVPMMFQEDSYAYYAGDSYQTLRLFYGAGDACLDLFLPGPTVPIQEFLRELNYGKYLVREDNLSFRPGEIRIPRLKFDYQSSLNDPLQALGLKAAFDPESADFSGMRPEKDILISEIKHKAVIEINEEGTEAAAITEIGVMAAGINIAPPPKFTFIADRPFFMMIRDLRAGVILFMGVVADPS